MSLIAAFIAGCFFAGMWGHRRARLDVETLLYVSQHPGSYGLDFINAKVAGGRGSIYVRLHRLEEEGLLTSVEEPGGPERAFAPRRRYFIKDLGLAALLIEAARRGGSDG